MQSMPDTWSLKFLENQHVPDMAPKAPKCPVCVKQVSFEHWCLIHLWHKHTTQFEVYMLLSTLPSPNSRPSVIGTKDSPILGMQFYFWNLVYFVTWKEVHWSVVLLGCMRWDYIIEKESQSANQLAFSWLYARISSSHICLARNCDPNNIRVDMKLGDNFKNLDLRSFLDFKYDTIMLHKPLLIPLWRGKLGWWSDFFKINFCHVNHFF